MTRVVVALAVLMAGCYDAPKPTCGFRCGPAAACPADYTCASDNRCHLDGTGSDIVCATPDAAPPTDAYSPAVIVTTPVAGSTVDPSSTINIGFDVDVAGVSSTSFTVTITSTTTPVIGAVSYSSTTRTATFTRANGLPPNEELLVKLTEDILDPLSQRMLMPTTFMFRTGADTTAPMVIQTTPAANATGVAVVSNMNFRFNEDVANVSNITVSLMIGGGPVVGTVIYFVGTREASFDPQDQLLPNTTYVGRVETAISDLAGNQLAAPFTSSFTTGNDTFAPQIRLFAPAVNGTNVPVNSNITVTFDEPVMNVDATSFTVNGGAIAGTVTLSNGNKLAVFDPTSDLPAASMITVNLSNAITDNSANPFVGFSYMFTTM